MGERKGTNKYYPPDFDPKKHGSLNRYHGSHPLRERARKLAQGILVIRFEMPFNIWCDGCHNHIGMGVRYNAEKKKVGNYYTTPIYRFRMKCHLCSHPLELQTDPAGCDYLIVSGARRKEERWNPRDNGQLQPDAPEQRQRLQQDPMLRLEQGEGDKATLQQALPSLQQLQVAQEAWKDDFALNCRLRQLFREEKKTLREEEEEEEKALGPRAGLGIPLLPEDEADRRLAALLTYSSPLSYEEKQRMKRSEISSRSWFSPAASSSGGAGGVLRKLWGGAAQLPAPPTPAGLGIVRRREMGAGVSEKGETPPKKEEEEREKQGSGKGDPSITESQKGVIGGDAPPPQGPSLVADYSDSSSEAEGS